MSINRTDLILSVVVLLNVWFILQVLQRTSTDIVGALLSFSSIHGAAAIGMFIFAAVLGLQNILQCFTLWCAKEIETQQLGKLGRHTVIVLSCVVCGVLFQSVYFFYAFN